MRCVINLNEFTFKDLKAAANSRVNAKFLLAKVKKTAQADFAKHVRETFRGVVYLDKKKFVDYIDKSIEQELFFKDPKKFKHFFGEQEYASVRMDVIRAAIKNLVR